MKNSKYFIIFGVLTAFISFETKANNGIQHGQVEEKNIVSDNKTSVYMKCDEFSDLIELLAAYKPKTQEDYESWVEYGKTFDLYRQPSDEPLTKKMIVCIYNKEKETEESKKELKNVEFIYSGEQFIGVMLNVFEQVKQPSIKFFVEALNYYKEKGEFLKIKH